MSVKTRFKESGCLTFFIYVKSNGLRPYSHFGLQFTCHSLHLITSSCIFSHSCLNTFFLQLYTPNALLIHTNLTSPIHFFQHANNLVSSSKPYKRVDTYIFLTTTNFIYYAIELQNNPPKKIKLQRGPWTG
jgi:hypothetical protein